MMNTIDPTQQIAYLRLLCLLGPVALAYLLLCFRTITYRQLTGIYLSILWCFISLLFLNPLIIELEDGIIKFPNSYSCRLQWTC